jgi:hypothetical protein
MPAVGEQAGLPFSPQPFRLTQNARDAESYLWVDAPARAGVKAALTRE